MSRNEKEVQTELEGKHACKWIKTGYIKLQ
jgi:hypothetical protein